MCDCGCDCCSDDWLLEGPVTIPAEGTPEYTMRQYYMSKIAERFNKDAKLFEKLYGK